MPIERAVGQAILKSLIQFNMPAWQMISIVKSAGYSYRYTTMLSDIREYTGRFKYETQIRSLAQNQYVPEAWMNRVDMPQPRKYKVWADVTWYDKATGQSIEGTKSMYFDENRPVGDYMIEFETSFDVSRYVTGRDVVSVQYRGMDINTRII